MVLDAFSRHVIGWALGRTLEAELTMTALRIPAAKGARTGAVSVSDTDGGSPQTVQLTGTGTGGPQHLCRNLL